jgi:hypothetical protein
MAENVQKKLIPSRVLRDARDLLPSDENGIFGPAPLIHGEDPATYHALLAKVTSEAKPRGILEEIWVREVVDLTWESFRLRRLKARLLDSSMVGGLADVLGSLDRRARARSLEDQSLIQGWADGDSVSRKKVEQRLARAGLSIEAVVAAALSNELDAFERFDRMIASAEARRNNALREIDRHRTILGAALHSAMEEPEDGVFTDAETELAANGSAQ